jgi:hypothetical protein
MPECVNVDTSPFQLSAPAMNEVLDRAAAQPCKALRQEQSGSLIFGDKPARGWTPLPGRTGPGCSSEPRRNEGTRAVLYLRALPAEFLKWEDPNNTFSGLASMQAGLASDRFQRAVGLQASTGMLWYPVVWMAVSIATGEQHVPIRAEAQLALLGGCRCNTRRTFARKPAPGRRLGGEARSVSIGGIHE